MSSKTWGGQLGPYCGGGRKMVAVPLPVAILDDPIFVSAKLDEVTSRGSDLTGNGTGLIQDGDQLNDTKRESKGWYIQKMLLFCLFFLVLQMTNIYRYNMLYLHFPFFFFFLIRKKERET